MSPRRVAVLLPHEMLLKYVVYVVENNTPRRSRDIDSSGTLSVLSLIKIIRIILFSIIHEKAPTHPRNSIVHLRMHDASGGLLLPTAG